MLGGWPPQAKGLPHGSERIGVVKRSRVRALVIVALIATPLRAAITIDYPSEGSVFPPDFAAPTVLWRDSADTSTSWQIQITFSDRAPGITVKSNGDALRVGEIDPRCVAATNELPELTPQQAAAHTWKPDAETWSAIKRHSLERPATITITGFRDQNRNEAVSRGRVTIQTSKDPVAAPIFYRDVPLMPSELQKGVIKPLSPAAVPLVAWRLRDVGEPRSRVVMEGLHTCANCHSFSADGKTLALDLDGPQNDKGMYAIVPVRARMSIQNRDVITWPSFREMGKGQVRVGFMSQVSPDGRYVATMVKGAMYVNNFKDYRFLQVFYPTRGILAWYSRETGRLQALPGADDPRYVHTNVVWSPDGKYLVFARAAAKDPYPAGAQLAAYANDPHEIPIQYDLYRIPFNGGRGGRAEPIAGASRNGMSNSFPKVSPDGRWIVFVQCRNGQLMRPDSQLYIVPAEGGQARRMRANTELMNSWHSFSPNGRWLVFSSKSRSPYTRMFLTHLDENGNDSPAILIENATAANRAVNIPEFVNIPPRGITKIDVPAVEYYRLLDLAWEFAVKGQYEAAIAEWGKALAIDSTDAKVHINLGAVLARAGKLDEAVAHFEKALEINPGFTEAHNNLGVILAQAGKFDLAIVHFQKVLEANPDSAAVHSNLGRALAEKGRFAEGIAHFRKAVELRPEFAEAHLNLANALYFWQGNAADALDEWRKVLRLEPGRVPVLSQMARVLATDPEPAVRNGAEAVELAARAVHLSEGQDAEILDTLAAAYAEAGRFPEAVETGRRALAVATRQNNRPIAESLPARIALYQTHTPYREARHTSALLPSP